MLAVKRLVGACPKGRRAGDAAVSAQGNSVLDCAADPGCG